jgi:hypothetical protein
MLRLITALLILLIASQVEAKRQPHPLHRRILIRTVEGQKVIRGLSHAPKRKPIRHIINDSPTIPSPAKYAFIE